MINASCIGTTVPNPTPLLTTHPLQAAAGAGERGAQLTDYYESLRNNVMSLLEHVKIPGSAPPPPQAGPNGLATPHHDNFDSYLSKIHSLCTDNYCDDQRPLYDSVRSALHDFTVPPTPI